MTDTPPPPERQSEATRALDDLGELIDQLASNAREFDYNAANRMERDAAKALLVIEATVNALPELLAMAEENARLREALQAIADRHIPDQPPAYDVSEADYARKHYMELRMLARAALKETGQ